MSFESHEAFRKSKEFRDELKVLERVNKSFLKAFMLITSYSSRSPYLNEKSLLFGDFADILESALSYQPLVREGILNVTRRELRYILETVCVHYVIDETHADASFEDRVGYLSSLGTQGKLELLKEPKNAPLEAFDEPTRQVFVADILQLFSDLSRFVHTSTHQIEERLRRHSLGRYSGFESPEDLRTVNRDIFRTLDIVLAIYLHALSLPLAGDIFTVVLDDEPEWRFHKGKWCGAVSRYFDYKHERQEKNQA